MNNRKNIAIIGSGIAGLASAYFLSNDCTITLFEKNGKLGGHIDTHYIKEDNGQIIAIDTGFISFNQKRYPEFIKMLDTLEVEYGKSEMNYGLFNKGEYNKGESLIETILSKYETYSPIADKIKTDAKKFFAIDNQKLNPEITIGDFMKTSGYSSEFFTEFLLPAVAGMLSHSIEGSKKIPLKRIYNYFENHELLGFQEYEDILYVKDGYDSYVQKIVEHKNVTVKNNTCVSSVVRTEKGVEVSSHEGMQIFDSVIMACEADIAFKILGIDISENEKEILEPFEYRENTSYLHNDVKIMPEKKSDWATYTMHISPDEKHGCYTIWLNSILQLNTAKDYFFTMNPWINIEKKSIIKDLSYRHLRPNAQVLQNQKELDTLNEKGPIYFAGSYFKYFHEDGVISAKKVSKQIIQFL